MSFGIAIIVSTSGLLILYGFGVFALSRQAGESVLSAAIEAFRWWATFSATYLFGLLTFGIY